MLFKFKPWWISRNIFFFLLIIYRGKGVRRWLESWEAKANQLTTYQFMKGINNLVDVVNVIVSEPKVITPHPIR